jgi:hypothetical protein
MCRWDPNRAATVLALLASEGALGSDYGRRSQLPSEKQREATVRLVEPDRHADAWLSLWLGLPTHGRPV